jgi:hypothetical protein
MPKVLINDIAPFSEGGDSFMCAICPLTGRNDFIAEIRQEFHANQSDEVCSEMKAAE